MRNYTFTVTVTSETKEQAEQVMLERMEFDDDDYGFHYRIDWEPVRATECPDPLSEDGFHQVASGSCDLCGAKNLN